MMYDLFNPHPENHLRNNKVNEIGKIDNFKNIKGLKYIPEFLGLDEERELIENINSQPWLSDIKRRVQHYGYKYDYRSRNIDYSMFLGELPFWALNIAYRLFNSGLLKELPDQVIVNEYLPGQGIANHVDCEPCFGDTIVSLSLATACTMNFINLESKEKVEIFLEPRSVVVIEGESRYCWSHGIPSRLADEYNNQRVNRGKRLSLTFRKVIIK